MRRFVSATALIECEDLYTCDKFAKKYLVLVSLNICEYKKLKWSKNTTMKITKKYRAIEFIRLPLKYIPYQAIFMILYAIIDALMPAYFAFVLANFINHALEIFSGEREFSKIFLSIILLVTYMVYIRFMPVIHNIISLSGRNKFNLKIREIILTKQISLAYMHVENAETQDLINRVSSNPDEQFFTGFNNLLSTSRLIITSFSLLIIIMTSTVIGGVGIMLISIPLFYLAMKVGKKNYEMGKESKRIQRRYNYLSSILTEREYSEERHLFGYSSNLQEKFAKLYQESYKIESNITMRDYINSKMGSIVTLVIIFVIILLLFPSLNNGSMDIGIFIAVINAIFGLVQGMSWRLINVMQNHARLQEYLKDINLFFELSEKKDASVVKNSSEKFDFESLEFKNVSFKYPGTKQYVLENCSFKLYNGKSYAFVGANGAGKSTIIKLITGLYDDFSGEILLNNQNIFEYDYAVIKALIAVVFQDFARYALTLEQNMTLGSSFKSDEMLLNDVIDKVGLVDLISGLTDGIQAPLGKIDKDGMDVSGGQWQRIALARLLYSQAKIHILDEPTSALDPVSESKLYELFNKLNKDKFTIFITHRLGAAKMADEILVIASGRVKELGNHRELILKKDGLYAKMYESQKSWYESEERV